MKKIILLLTLALPVFLSTKVNSEESYYTQLAASLWTRNFEEATPSQNNDGIESTEFGYAVGLGYRLNSSWAFELEYLKSSDFSAENQGRQGELSVMAVTIAPKYSFSPRFFDDRLSLFGKIRFGYTQIDGTSLYGNDGSNESSTFGLGFGMDYKVVENLESFIDIGGLWASGDVEDYDFHSWQIGMRYFF